MPIPNTMTRETIRAIIDSVEYDPLAGMGCYSKKDLLADRLLAHCRAAHHVATNSAPGPILSEVPHTDVKQIDAKKEHDVKHKAA